MVGGRYEVFFCVEKKRQKSIVVVVQNVFWGPPFFFFFFVSLFCVMPESYISVVGQKIEGVVSVERGERKSERKLRNEASSLSREKKTNRQILKSSSRE